MGEESRKTLILRIFGGAGVIIGLICLVGYRCSDFIVVGVGLIATAITLILTGVVILIDPEIVEEFRPSHRHHD